MRRYLNWATNSSYLNRAGGFPTMNLSDYRKLFKNEPESLEEMESLRKKLEDSCAKYFEKLKLNVKSLEITEIHGSFVVVKYDDGNHHKFISVSLNSFINKFQGGCQSCQKSTQ